MRQAGMSGLLLAACLGGGWTAEHASAQSTMPGGGDAVEAATDQAVEDAVSQLLRTLPETVDTVAVLVVYGDREDLVRSRMEHHLIQRGLPLGLKVVTRQPAEWDLIEGEFEFSEANFDGMPQDQIRKWGELLGADALVWSRVREAGMDDTGLQGRARIEARLGIVETGQLAGSADARAAADIDGDTLGTGLAMRALNSPLFWPVVVVGVVGGFVFFVAYSKFKRRMDLASKPREIIR
jgi:hypothetical protein